MEHPALQQILTECARPPAQEATVDYLAENLGKFVKVGIPAMICIPPTQGNLAELMRRAVLQCGGVPVMIGDDLRWKSLLRLGFSTKAETVIGPPLIVLGLTKLSKATGIPLFIQNVLTFGYPCLDWMIDGIIHGLDCSTWGCYTPEADVAVAGFSCGRCRGIHLRTKEFGMDIVDEGGRPLGRAPGALRHRGLGQDGQCPVPVREPGSQAAGGDLGRRGGPNAYGAEPGAAQLDQCAGLPGDKGTLWPGNRDRGLSRREAAEAAQLRQTVDPPLGPGGGCADALVLRKRSQIPRKTH
ncbi:MAG: hypothetical protein LUJ09_02570 [Firmicutes bacterium]|nr:hypothetical protein [Bacillota bacterium]